MLKLFMLLAEVQGYICIESHVLAFKTKATRHARKSSSLVALLAPLSGTIFGYFESDFEG